LIVKLIRDALKIAEAKTEKGEEQSRQHLTGRKYEPGTAASRVQKNRFTSNISGSS
jgi:hypothetical protein